LCLVDLIEHIYFFSFMIVSQAISVRGSVLAHHDERAEEDRFQTHEEREEAIRKRLDSQQDPEPKPDRVNADKSPEPTNVVIRSAALSPKSFGT